MIVRILGEGQYRLADGDVAALQDLDAQLERAVEGDDDDEFRREVRERNSIPGVCREPPLPPACMELRDGRLHLREGP